MQTQIKNRFDIFLKQGSKKDAWTVDKWEVALTDSIPEWREIIKDSSNWDDIEKMSPEREYVIHYWLALLNAGGLDLAKRWFDSKIREQKTASDMWFHKNIALWEKFDERIQRYILQNCFSIFDNSFTNILTPQIWNSMDKDMQNDFLISFISAIKERYDYFSEFLKQQNLHDLIYHFRGHFEDISKIVSIIKKANAR